MDSEVYGIGPDTPWLTWTIAGLIAVTSLASFTQGHDIINAWGLIPKEALRHHGLTFITSFFLHGSLWHLIGNLYFLVVFGGAVERYTGSWRWLLILGAATLSGGAFDIAIQPQSSLPLIGASGGISGLLVYFGLKFPKAQAAIPIRFLFVTVEWSEIPARRCLIFWVLLQFVGAWTQLHGLSSVAALAHLGGGAAGAVLWLVWKIWPFDLFDEDDRY